MGGEICEDPQFPWTEMIPEPHTCSFALKATQQGCREQKSREPVSREQMSFDQWNDYRNVLLFWRYQEARQRQAPRRKPQLTTRVNHSFSTTSASATSSSVRLSDPETQSPVDSPSGSLTYVNDRTQFFDALDCLAPHLMLAASEAKKSAQVEDAIRRHRYGLLLRPVCLLMALACVIYVIVSAINLYLTPPFLLPEALPLPFYVDYQEEKPASEEPSFCNWECLAYLWK